MSIEVSCAVEVRKNRSPTSDGPQYDWEVAFCHTCGAGAIRIWKDGLFQSFTTTGPGYESCVVRGPPPELSQVSTELSHRTPCATPEQLG